MQWPQQSETGRAAPTTSASVQTPSDVSRPSFIVRLMGGWLRLTSPHWPHAPKTLAERDLARRARLAAQLFLGFFVACLVLLVALLASGSVDMPTLIALIVVMVGIVVGILLNRAGQVSFAGIIVVAIILAAVLGADLNAPGGMLDPYYLPSYDLLALTVVVAVALLPSWVAFFIAFVNSALICLDFLVLQPWTHDLTTGVNANGLGLLLGRPIGLQIAIATIGFLWARGYAHESNRADQAEALAELERREIERQRELEEGVRELLATHVQVANGNFGARTPQLRNPMLWQIGASLNNLISRFARLAQADFIQRRTQEEIHRLADAFRMMRTGRQPIWPVPSGTPLDELIDVLQVQRAPLAAPDQGQMPLPSGPTYPPLAPRSSNSATGALYGGNSMPEQVGATDPNELPEWLRPQSQGGFSSQQPFSGDAPAPQPPGSGWPTDSTW